MKDYTYSVFVKSEDECFGLGEPPKSGAMFNLKDGTIVETFGDSNAFIEYYGGADERYTNAAARSLRKTTLLLLRIPLIGRLRLLWKLDMWMRRRLRRWSEQGPGWHRIGITLPSTEVQPSLHPSNHAPTDLYGATLEEEL
jgi:hypothetical protein